MLAPAKINLDLLITGKRADGYHLLDSIVVFADIGDEITAELSDHLSLSITGDFAHQLDENSDNLILKAARIICEKAGILPHIKFNLVKNLPVSSGIGGGSADAAAAVKLCIELFDLNIDHNELNRLALTIGADVPVCLMGKSVQMCGIGEKLTNLNIFDPLYLILVNPGVTVSTAFIFNEYAKINQSFDETRKIKSGEIHFPFMIEKLIESQNSLQKAALKMEPVIGKVMAAINETDNVIISRMSGSGATCFGLYENGQMAMKAAKIITGKYPHWWVQPVLVN